MHAMLQMGFFISHFVFYSIVLAVRAITSGIHFDGLGLRIGKIQWYPLGLRLKDSFW
jgi:hypothetical protein